MKEQKRHNLAYGVSGLLILAFFVWTFNLVVDIQDHWAESNEPSQTNKLALEVLANDGVQTRKPRVHPGSGE